MKAFILAGGFGTRLQSVVSDVPKSMALVNGKPFLSYILDNLRKNNFKEVYIGVGYLHDKVITYYGYEYYGLPLKYIIEEFPLGTGGAIQMALSEINLTEPLFILNGDTFVTFNPFNLLNKHRKHSAKITIALQYMENCDRYGNVEIKNNRIQKFNEKGIHSPGYINAGVYLVEPNLFQEYSNPTVFSFEAFLVENIANLKAAAYCMDGYFIDIGIPEDYSRAQTELSLVVG